MSDDRPHEFYATLARAVHDLNPVAFTRYGADEGPALGSASCVMTLEGGQTVTLMLDPVNRAVLKAVETIKILRDAGEPDAIQLMRDHGEPLTEKEWEEVIARLE